MTDTEFHGEQDLSKAHARLQELTDMMGALRKEKAALEVWIAETLPVDNYQWYATEHGMIRRVPRFRRSQWDNEQFVKDCLVASAAYDGEMQRLHDPDTGEVIYRPRPSYRAGWDAACRLNTMSGDKVKTRGGLDKINLNRDLYCETSPYYEVETRA